MAAAILFELHGQLTRLIADKTGVHFQGISQAGRSLKLSSKVRRRLVALDAATHYLRHATTPLAARFLLEVKAEVEARMSNPGGARASSTAFKAPPARFRLASDESAWSEHPGQYVEQSGQFVEPPGLERTHVVEENAEEMVMTEKNTFIELMPKNAQHRRRRRPASAPPTTTMQTKINYEKMVRDEMPPDIQTTAISISDATTSTLKDADARTDPDIEDHLVRTGMPTCGLVANPTSHVQEAVAIMRDIIAEQQKVRAVLDSGLFFPGT